MKRFSCFIVVAIIICISLCACGSYSSTNPSSEISEAQALILFKKELISEVENKWGSTYYDLSKFTYNYDSIEDEGTSYRITGEYDIYFINGEYLKSAGFSGTVNKFSSGVYIDSIFRSTN